MLEKTKYCKRCDRTLSISHFHNNKYTKDGKRFYCKDCVAEYGKKYRKTCNGVWTSIKSRQIYYHKHNHPSIKPFVINKQEFFDWYENEPKFCAYCDIPEEKLYLIKDDPYARRANRLTVDCKNNELGYRQGNLVLSCRRCNGLKNYFFTFEQWREIAQRFIKPVWEKQLDKNS